MFGECPNNSKLLKRMKSLHDKSAVEGAIKRLGQQISVHALHVSKQPRQRIKELSVPSRWAGMGPFRLIYLGPYWL